MDNLNQDAAIAIRHALMNGGNLVGIAAELGKLAALYPVDCLPINEALFNTSLNLEMMNAYNDAVTVIERLKRVDLSD